MSVLIRGMDLPERCEDCGLIYETEGYCVCPFTKAGVISKHRPSYCPLIPAADVRPVVHGEWIVKTDADGKTYGVCSECGYKQYAGHLKFCPNCGAKMEEVSE